MTCDRILSLRTGYAMLRGEVRLIDFEPAVGQEPNKTRPALPADLQGTFLISLPSQEYQCYGYPHEW